MVSHKILERHQGKLEVVTPKTGQGGHRPVWDSAAGTARRRLPTTSPLGGG
jgi:hypothetical protein